MLHISEQYGSPANLLQVSAKELEAVEAFLRGLGVRCRLVSWNVNGSGEYIIQAENPYRAWIGAEDRKIADKDMTAEGIARYKR